MKAEDFDAYKATRDDVVGGKLAVLKSEIEAMILQTEDRFEIKLQDIRKDARTFEVFSNGKFREFEKANAERPTDTYMRDYVSSMFTTMIAEIKAPLENDASLAKTRLTDLELAL